MQLEFISTEYAEEQLLEKHIINNLNGQLFIIHHGNSILLASPLF